MDAKEELAQWLKDAVGEDEHEVTRVAKEGGATVRVTRRDGKYFVVTRDLDMARLNLEIEGGKVTRASMG